MFHCKKQFVVGLLTVIAIVFCVLNLSVNNSRFLKRKAEFYDGKNAIAHGPPNRNLIRPYPIHGEFFTEPSTEPLTEPSSKPSKEPSKEPLGEPLGEPLTKDLPVPLNETSPKKASPKKASVGPKIILFWTAFFGGQNSYMREEGDRLRNQECPVSNCILSDDRSLANQSSALIFHAVDFNANDLPAERDSDQFWTFFTLESPEHSFAPNLPFLFNLTFTYRFDSDIIADNYLQYFRPKLLKHKEQFDEIWTKKTNNKAAIFVSNCVSARMEYVKELSKHYPVDIFGGCGNMTCPREKREDCDQLVSSYKFYLSFENGLCQDYVTEKSVRGYMADTIPVFMGSANYSAIFPVHSFLDVADFATPADLAKEMHRISNDRAAYFEFFTYRYHRQRNRLPDYLQPENVSLCKLCEILNDPDIESRRLTYPDLSEWWVAGKDCRAPTWSFPVERKPVDRQGEPVVSLTVPSITPEGPILPGYQRITPPCPHGLMSGRGPVTFRFFLGYAPSVAHQGPFFPRPGTMEDLKKMSTQSPFK